MAEESDELLRIEYIPLDLALLWEDNHKRHDIPALIKSFERYGFKDPPKYEPTLNKGRGGIVEGNGRMEALAEMRRQNIPAPRGIPVIEGAWMAPVLFGVDAASEAAASAYGIDHNNLTLAGPGFDAHDLVRLWSDGFVEQLQRLSEAETLPVSVTEDDIKMIQYWDEGPGESQTPDLDDLADQYGEYQERDFWPYIRVQVSPDTMELWQSLMERTGIKDEAEAAAMVLGAVDATVLGAKLS